MYFFRKWCKGVSVAFGILLPGSVMVCSVICVLIKMMFERQKMEELQEDVIHKRRAMKLLLLLCTVYFFFFLLVTVMSFLEVDDKSLESAITLFLYQPVYIVNFLFYNYEKQVFRNGAKYLLQDIKQCIGRTAKLGKESEYDSSSSSGRNSVLSSRHL